MNTRLYKTVAEMLNDQSVITMSMPKLMDKAVFHRIMGVPGVDGGCRYRITDRYLKLITEYSDEEHL